MPVLANNSFTYGGAANVQATDVAFSIHTHVESAFYDVLYPEHEWRKYVLPEQVITDINPGATEYAYITRDRRGAAAFVGNGPNDDIPMVGQSIGSIAVPIVYAAVGARITDEDARRYTMGFYANLADDLGQTMKIAVDNLVEASVLFGNQDYNLLPLLNYPGVTAQNAPAGSGGGTQWSTKTAEEILSDINTALSDAIISSRTLFKPDILILPIENFSIISTVPMVLGGTNLAMTIHEYVKKNNIVTAYTGKELTIFASRYLSDAGIGQTRRAIFMDRSAQNQILPFPMPYRVGEPIAKPLAAEWYAQLKFGSYHVRQPGSMYYLDAI